MKLSKRLELVLSFVKPVETAADIGTDHAYVPVELVRRGTAKHAVAADVRKGPLLRAKESIASAGLEHAIDTRLSDGLAGFLAGEAGAVVIAGMGGELLLHIMEQGRHMWDTVTQWILSPQSELYKVRKWLPANGFAIEKEGMVSEDGKYYTVMSVVRAGTVHDGCEADRGAGCTDTETIWNHAEGTGHEPDINAGCRDAGTDRLQAGNLRRREEEFYYGRYLIEAKDPVLLAYLREERGTLTRLKETLERQAQSSRRAVERLAAVEKMLCYNQEVEDEML
ncbi:SAM-dependent methyltransferase [bacterium 1XD42-94]|nr:SAM-dependent methyltransferase [bacterium 1XD42-76]NBK03886.1 SAM-dependent methyltransferase [bacterium 1XD42-94]